MMKMKKKLKRILKNEWVKKVIIILLAILVASITTSFCFGIKEAEGGCGSCADDDKTPVAEATQAQASEKALYFCPMHPTVTSDKPGLCSICKMSLERKEAHGYVHKATSPRSNEDEDDGEDFGEDDDEGEDEGEEDKFDFGEEDEDDADEEEDAEDDARDSGRKKRVEKFQCDIEKDIKGKTTDEIVKILGALHKDEHKKRYDQDQEIDDLKDEVKSYREQNMILLATIDKMDRRFATMFSTQFGLLDPAMTPERMEATIGDLRAKKEELVSGISQRNSLLSAIGLEIKRLERKKKLTADEQVQLSLHRIQKKQVEQEIGAMTGSLEEILTRAKLIEARRSQVTGQEPTRPFGPETVPQGQTPETAAQGQPAPQSLNTEDQIRPLLVALLRRGNRNGRQPAIQPNAFSPNRNIVDGQRPPLSGRGQRGIIAE